MADLRVTAATTTQATGALSQTAKASRSKFDLISNQITQKLAAEVKLPSVAPPSSQQISAIQRSLNQQLEKTKAGSAAEFFRADMKQTRIAMDKLTTAAAKLPPPSNSSGLQNRLKDLEQQFEKSGDLIKGLNDMDPKSLLNVQIQLYQLTGNIEVMSKVMEHMTSGVKTMLQTQV
jgi:hypothetical protein